MNLCIPIAYLDKNRCNGYCLVYEPAYKSLYTVCDVLNIYILYRCICSSHDSLVNYAEFQIIIRTVL